MDTGTLKQILLEEMQLYATQGLNAYSILTINEAEQVYAVIDFATVRGEYLVAAVLVARLVDNIVHIDLDLNNKLLVDALHARGVPESQIVLTYRQEPKPLPQHS
jgi:hypothetical protein